MRITGNIVCILPDGNPNKTKSGIIVPKTVKELPNTGIVIDHGPMVEAVEKGKKVIFARKAGSVLNIDDIEHLLVPEDKISYVYP